MNLQYQQFLDQSEKRAFDQEQRKSFFSNIANYNQAVKYGKEQYLDLDLAKKRASNIKNKVINKIDSYLIEFTTNFEKRGGKVIWAPTEKDAQREILTILKRVKAKTIVKKRSIVSAEVMLNDLMEKNRRQLVITDLDEYILKMMGEKSTHFVSGTIHKSNKEINTFFQGTWSLGENTETEIIIQRICEEHTNELVKADVGITGANFLIANPGGVALTENEGNGMFSSTYPKIHIVLAGIEMIIPTMEELDLFFPLLATHATGQKISVYNTILFGPRMANESDGPDEMYVILIDNRRTELLKNPDQRVALSCIHCGACLNACPIYKQVGGTVYDTIYTGPIGAVVSPFYQGMREYNHLSFASTLCGKCSEDCPVNIPLHEVLLRNRKEAIERKHTQLKWKKTIRIWKYIMLRRWILDKPGVQLKTRYFTMKGKKMWGQKRTFPTIANKSFKDLWNSRSNG